MYSYACRFCERLSLSVEETLFHSVSFGLNGAEWRVHRCRVSSIDRAGALRRWPRRRWRRIRGCRDLANPRFARIQFSRPFLSILSFVRITCLDRSRLLCHFIIPSRSLARTAIINHARSPLPPFLLPIPLFQASPRDEITN